MAEPGRNILAEIMISAISLYRTTLGVLLPNACRFSPTCSAYASDAIRTHGPGRGAWLALQRIMRCHPFHPGGYDPVPSRHTPEEK